jgi:hypothetical protein
MGHVATTERLNGTAVVIAVRPAKGVCRVDLRYADGRTIALDIPVEPDLVAGRRDATAVRRSLAVRLSVDPPYDGCWLLGTSRRGPTRRRVTMGSALALAASGVHSVVVG